MRMLQSSGSISRGNPELLWEAKQKGLRSSKCSEVDRYNETVQDSDRIKAGTGIPFGRGPGSLETCLLRFSLRRWAISSLRPQALAARPFRLRAASGFFCHCPELTETWFDDHIQGQAIPGLKG